VARPRGGHGQGARLRGWLPLGSLAADADPGELALTLLAAVQGGLLLSQVRGETRPLEAAIDTVLARISGLAVPAPNAVMGARQR
jgi:TetR/AcrR family transcriptional regulator, transcriptional repressor for nem operon